MNIIVEEQEFTIKSRQAIEILDLIEKSNVFKSLKSFDAFLKDPNKSFENVSSLFAAIPNAYKLASDIVSLATGSLKDGKVVPNNTIVDDIDAMKLPFYASSIFKLLITPLSYVLTEDTLEAEKKSSTQINEETKNGNNEKPPDQKVE
jgi:hypothetical protein